MTNPTHVPSPQQLTEHYLQWMRMRNCSPTTIVDWRQNMRRFNRWCAERGIDCVTEITAETLAAYRRYLYHYRKPRNGEPLKFATQLSYLMSVRRWFLWLTEQEFIEHNVAAKLELPKEEQRLPMDILTADEVEQVLNTTDITTPLGLRDRALIETLYSTAIRRRECANLQVYDVDTVRRIVIIQQGKGKKDRVVPIGERALRWLNKYTTDVRPQLVSRTASTHLFVSCTGASSSRPICRRS